MEQEVLQLIADGVIDVTRLRQPSTSIKLRRSKQSTPGKRKSLWTRPIIADGSSHPPRTRRFVPTTQPLQVQPTTFWRWCKQLSSSDAQQVTSATNPTGKLRLSKAGFPIDHRTAFRQELFANQNWQSRVQRGKAYEVAEVDFEGTVRGVTLGTLRLIIDLFHKST